MTDTTAMDIDTTELMDDEAVTEPTETVDVQVTKGIESAACQVRRKIEDILEKRRAIEELGADDFDYAWD